MANLRIEDYALIGDCVTAALVGRSGSIDWLCLPRCDSPACFAALLGKPEHGRWLIAPSDPAHRVERYYLNDSLVLATTFETSAGAEGRDLFEKLLGLTNGLGLLAQEYEPLTQRQVGNFPQAFSHVALVNTAFNLTRSEGPAEQRADPRGRSVGGRKCPLQCRHSRRPDPLSPARP